MSNTTNNKLSKDGILVALIDLGQNLSVAANPNFYPHEKRHSAEHFQHCLERARLAYRNIKYDFKDPLEEMEDLKSILIGVNLNHVNLIIRGIKGELKDQGTAYWSIQDGYLKFIENRK